MEILPNLVNQSGLPLPDLLNKSDSVSSESRIEKYLSVDYVSLIPYIIKSIQEQQLIIEEQGLIIKSLLQANSALPETKATTNGIPYIISLSPNPAQNLLDIELYSENKSSLVTIYNRDGRIYESMSTTETKFQVSLDNFENGVYIISLSVNGTTFDINDL